MELYSLVMTVFSIEGILVAQGPVRNTFHYLNPSLFFHRLIEPINLEKAVDLYQKAAGVFEVNLPLT